MHPALAHQHRPENQSIGHLPSGGRSCDVTQVNLSFTIQPSPTPSVAKRIDFGTESELNKIINRSGGFAMENLLQDMMSLVAVSAFVFMAAAVIGAM
jgi:hypothetical protein